jgi:aryl-alcohol dehydrogenase-like predicted oxidoreductase
MPERRISRRDFVKESALAAGGLAIGASALHAAGAGAGKILNYNENMEYRRLGKTGLMVSAACLGGHWKRVDTMVPALRKNPGWMGGDLNDPAFQKNRYDVVTRCIEVGINYVDACSGAEVLAYSKAIEGRRDKMYLGYSWYEYEMRFSPWRESLAKMMEGLDSGLKQAKLDYVDLWRISLEMDTAKKQTQKEIEITMEALARAKQQGKARFIGVSSHDRPWLKEAVEKYPRELEVILTPYTAASKVRPEDSLFDAVKKCDVGVLGIKPFASNSIFKGDSSLASPEAEEDDKRARLAIRYILSNPALTAPMPGLINTHQVDNVAKAVQERRQLDQSEKAHLDKAMDEAWAKLPDDYQWLKDWEYV